MKPVQLNAREPNIRLLLYLMLAGVIVAFALMGLTFAEWWPRRGESGSSMGIGMLLSITAFPVFFAGLVLIGVAFTRSSLRHWERILAGVAALFAIAPFMTLFVCEASRSKM